MQAPMEERVAHRRACGRMAFRLQALGRLQEVRDRFRGAPEDQANAHSGGKQHRQPADIGKIRLRLFAADAPTAEAEIGRASCRERVCQYVLNSGVAVSLKKKKTN